MDLEQLWPELFHTLKVVPPPHEEVESISPYTKAVMTHNRLISKLIETDELKGLLIRGQPKGTITQHGGHEVKYSQGCLFIPAPYFDKVILIKNVTNIDKGQASIAEISDSLKEQLDLVQHCDVSRIYLCLCAKTNKLKKELDAQLKSTPLSVTNPIKLTHHDGLISDLQKLASSHSHGDVQTALIESAKAELAPDKFQFRLKREQFRNLTGQSTFQNVDRIVHLADVYFKDRDDKVEVVPDYDRIVDNILYCTTKEGALESFDKTASYFGEVIYFIEKLLSKLETKSGILLKDYSNTHFSMILDEGASEKPSDFQFDWLYLGKDCFVVFEVGLGDHDKIDRYSAINNKIMQCITKIIPQFSFLIHTLLQNLDNCAISFKDFVEQHFKVVVFLPNTTLEQFKNFCQKLKSKNKKLKQTAEFYCRNAHAFNSIVFMLVDESDLQLPMQTYQIDSDMNVMKAVDKYVESLFEKPGETINKQLRYISSVIALSSLMAVSNGTASPQNDLHDLSYVSRNEQPLEVDERYLETFPVWAKNSSNAKFVSTGINFILSPEQHRILSNPNKPLLMVYGQPGTGKTSLLLAKFQQMAERDDISEVYFTYPEGKTAFKRWLDNLMEKSGSMQMKRKGKFLAVQNIKSEKW